MSEQVRGFAALFDEAQRSPAYWDELRTLDARFAEANFTPPPTPPLRPMTHADRQVIDVAWEASVIEVDHGFPEDDAHA